MPTIPSEKVIVRPRPGGLQLAVKWGILAAVVTAIISIFCPNYYVSEAKFLPVDSRSSGGLGQLAAAAAAFGVGVPGQDSGDANFVDILNSRSIREDLLKAEYQFKARNWRFGPERVYNQTLYSYIKAKNMDRAVKSMEDIITTVRDVKSRIISVKVETTSPELSQQILMRTTKDLESFVEKKGRTRGGEKARFSQDRLTEARGEMAQAEETFRHFLETNRNYQTSPDPTVRLFGLRLEAELKLRQQLVMTLAMNLEQAFLEEKNDIPIVNALDEPNLPIEKSKPSRSALVLLGFILVTSAAWAWMNRLWIRSRVLDMDGNDFLPISNKESA